MISCSNQIIFYLMLSNLIFKNYFHFILMYVKSYYWMLCTYTISLCENITSIYPFLRSYLISNTYLWILFKENVHFQSVINLMFIFIIRHLLLCMICLHKSTREGPEKLSHEFFVGFIWSNNNRDHRAHCQRNYKIVRHSPKRWEWRKCWLMPVKFMGRNFLILVHTISN